MCLPIAAACGHVWERGLGAFVVKLIRVYGPQPPSTPVPKQDGSVRVHCVPLCEAFDYHQRCGVITALDWCTNLPCTWRERLQLPSGVCCTPQCPLVCFAVLRQRCCLCDAPGAAPLTAWYTCCVCWRLCINMRCGGTCRTAALSAAA